MEFTLPGTPGIETEVAKEYAIGTMESSKSTTSGHDLQ
jgi:hypothetical protein